MNSRLLVCAFALSIALAPNLGQAGACCGGSSGVPGLILGDFASQINTQLLHKSVVGDADPQEEITFRHEDHSETRRTLQIDGSLITLDFWQFGGGFNHITQEKNQFGRTESSQGVGDVWLYSAWEFLPELSYSPVKPRGHLVGKISLPVGRSIYDFEMPLATDIRSSGFFTPSLGLVLTKQRGRWDFSVTSEVHQALSRQFPTSRGPLTVTPGPGGSGTLGAGYSWPSLTRLGFEVGGLYESPRIFSGAQSGKSEDQLVWNVGLRVSQMWKENWSASLAYLDQTLLGPARNTTLERGIGLQLSWRDPL